MKHIISLLPLLLAATLSTAQVEKYHVVFQQHLANPINQVSVGGNVTLDIVQDTANYVVLLCMMERDQIPSAQLLDSLVRLREQTLHFDKVPSQGELQLHLATQRLCVTTAGTSHVRLRGVSQYDTLRYSHLEMRTSNHAYLYVASPCVADSVIAVAENQSAFLHEYLKADHIGVDHTGGTYFHPLSSYDELLQSDLLDTRKKDIVNLRYFLGFSYMMHTAGATPQAGEVLPARPSGHAEVDLATTFAYRGKWAFDLGCGYGTQEVSFGKRRVAAAQDAAGQSLYMQQAASGNGEWRTNLNLTYLCLPLTATCQLTTQSRFSLSLIPKFYSSLHLFQSYDEDCYAESYSFKETNRRKFGGDIRVTYGYRSWRLYAQVSPISPLKDNTQRYIPIQFGMQFSIVE